MISRKAILALAVLPFATVPLALAQSNPVPLINNPLVPTRASPGGPSFTLTVNGTGFVSGSVVNWNSSALATVFVSGSQVTATVPAASVALAGTASVTVVNPAPGGGLSNVDYFDIRQSFSAVGFGTTTSATGPAPEFPIAADVNHDGILDVLVLDINTNINSDLSVLLGNGDGTFQPHVDYTLTWGAGAPVTGDFNDDGNLDFAESDSGGLQVLLGNGDGTFQSLPEQITIPTAIGTAVGDFNGDGKLDLAMTTIYNGTSEVLIALGNGDGTFAQFASYPVGIQDTEGITTGDFNGDGKLDLAVVLSSEAQTAVLLGNGDGTFQSPVEYATGIDPFQLITADFNRDGKLDLAVQGALDTSVLLGNGDGTFQTGTNYALLEVDPLGIAAVDLNGDGQLDIAVPSQSKESLVVYLGNADGTFKKPATFNIGKSTGIAAGDFNGDGKIDLATSNGNVTVLLQADSVLSQTYVNFGKVKVGTISAKVKSTLTNIGNSSITIDKIAVTGKGKNQFRETNNCPATLSSGASCVITSTFAPQSAGNYSAIVQVTDSGADVSQTIDLKGTGD